MSVTTVLVLLAVFGPDYECLWANVEANGRASDATTWKSYHIKLALSSDRGFFFFGGGVRLNIFTHLHQECSSGGQYHHSL